jgi:hypothetical protein
MLRGMMFRMPGSGGLRGPSMPMQHLHHLGYPHGLQSMHEMQLQQVQPLLPSLTLYTSQPLPLQHYALQNAASNPIPPPIPMSLSALTGVAQIPLVKVWRRRWRPRFLNRIAQVEINRGNDSDGDSPPASGGAAGTAAPPIFQLQTSNNFQAALSGVCLTRCESEYATMFSLFAVALTYFTSGSGAAAARES